MKYLVPFLLLVLLITNRVTAQQKIIDSLQIRLMNSSADTDRVLLLNGMARIYSLFKPDTALILAQEAYNLSMQLHYPRGEALSLNRIASAYGTVGDYPKALQFLTKALKIYEDIRDQPGISRSINNMGDIYMTRGDYKKALEYFIQSKNKEPGPVDNYFHTIVLLNIGECYLNINEPDSALFYLEANYPVAKQNRYEDLYGDFERLLGEVQSAKGHFDQSLISFNKSISSYKNVDDKQHLSISYRSIAKLYQKLNQQDSAIAYAKMALTTAQAGSYNQGIFNASKLLSEYYEGKNDHEAFGYLKIATAAKDSLFSQEKVKQLLSLSFEEKQRQQEMEASKAEYESKVKIYIMMVFW